jgi:hypothetical protein
MRRATKSFLHQLMPKQIIKENGLDKFRLHWRGMLGVMACTLIICLVSDYFGRFELARPAWFSAMVLCVAIAFRWQLRRYAWFWIAIAFFIAIHVVVIVSLTWSTKWFPAAALAGLGSIDLYLMLVIVSIVRKFMSIEPPIQEKHSSAKAHHKSSNQQTETGD